MAKPTSKFTCTNCGHVEPKWVGKCPMCGEWNTFEEEAISKSVNQALSGMGGDISKLVNLSDINISESERISTGLKEFDRTLGGGFVKDEVVLLSGEPGVGKSTILMQICSYLADKDKVLYVSAEESDKQVAGRFQRINPNFKDLSMEFISTGNLNTILHTIDSIEAEFIVVDSIQTIFDDSLTTIPGGVSQVKSCASKLVYHSKLKGKTLIIIGHINKDGKLAGPKVLEHLVDCVLHLESQKNGEYRILRSLKNRFGSTGEVGIFEMTEKGLVDMSVEKGFVTSSDDLKEKGVAKTFVVEGSRPVLIDVQSLVNKTIFAYPKRVSEGISNSKLQLIAAICDSYKIANLNEADAYVRIAGGYSIKDYSYADLGIVASLVSAFKGFELSQKNIYIGEVSLNTSVSLPPFFHKYIKEIVKVFPDSKLYGNFDAIKLTASERNRVVSIRSLSELISKIK